MAGDEAPLVPLVPTLPNLRDVGRPPTADGGDVCRDSAGPTPFVRPAA